MYTLSVVLNLHREAARLEKTILNIRAALSQAKHKEPCWEHIDFVTILDNSDDAVRAVVFQNRDILTTVEEVSYGDLAQSRNHGVALAKSNFILFADGDDFVSTNTFTSLYQTFFDHYSKQKVPLESLLPSDHIAVFPEWLVDFPKLHFQHYSDSNEFIVANMRFSHCFISRIACPKTLLKTNPLRANQLPYGFEDWDLNNRLLSYGVKFKVAADYTLYYRTGNPSSMLQRQIKNRCVVRNSNLYQSLFIPKETLQKSSYTYTSNTNTIINLSEFIKKHVDFLSNCGEKILEEPPIDQLFHDMHYTSTQFTSFSAAYERILLFLESEKAVAIVPNYAAKSLQFINQFSSIPSEAQAIIAISGENNKHNLTNNLLILSQDIDWESIHEEAKLHVLLKALINSPKLKHIHFFSSPFIDVLRNYYKDIYAEFCKTITCE